MEVKKMKKSLLCLMFALLVISLTLSTAAAQPQKLYVSGTQSGSSAIIYQSLTDGGIYTQCASGTGQVTLNIEGSSTPLVLKTSSEISLIVNTKTDKGVIHFDMKFAKIVDGAEAGSFEGQINGHTLTFAYLSNGYPNYPAQTESYIHGVLQGTGIYEGQKLTLDGIRVIGKPLAWEGFLSVN
jgi:hypothetical protein